MLIKYHSKSNLFISPISVHANMLHDAPLKIIKKNYFRVAKRQPQREVSMQQILFLQIQLSLVFKWNFVGDFFLKMFTWYANLRRC